MIDNVMNKCKHKRKVYQVGNTYCADCHVWLHSGMAEPEIAGRVAMAMVIALICFWLMPSVSEETRQSFAIGNEVMAAMVVAAHPQLPLGNPSGATADVKNADNYLIEKEQYALSYNSAKGGPNWVSWTLVKSDIGRTPRQNDFHAEELLPDGFQKVKPADYAGSGYDKGHMCDSEDRTRTIADNHETFSMANMLPQTAELNEQVWKRFEAYSRKLAEEGHTLAIVAGCYGTQGEIKAVHAKAKRQVNVPERCWKVVVDEDGGELAVDMPNNHKVAHDAWQKYSTTVEDVEKKTGFHFLLPRNAHELAVSQ
jgi:endonuclease G